MSVIKLPLLFVSYKTEKQLYTLFDSEANLSCIHPDHAIQLAHPQPLFQPRWLSTAIEGQSIQVTHVVQLEFFIQEVLVSDEFLVVPGLTEEVVIGAVTMQKWRMQLDFEKDAVIVDPKVMKMQII